MRRLPPLSLSVLLGTLALSTTVAAQSENRALVDGLESQLLAVAIPIALAVLGAFVYAVYRFRETGDRTAPAGEDERRTEGESGSGSESEPGPDPGSGPEPGPALEITWTLAAAIVLLFVGVASYSVLASPYVSPDQSVEVDGEGDPDSLGLESLDAGDDADVYVRASQWDWNASYPDAEVTTRNEIVIPADENVTIWLTSDDVVHSLFVPGLGVKQDAIPGQYTRVRTVAYDPGEYDVRCTEFCGTGHAEMTGTVVVLESEAYEAWLSAQGGDGSSHDGYENENGTNATAFLESDAG